MMLRQVGFFQELNHGDPAGPKLADLMNDRPQPDETKISDYLRNGLLLIGCPGVVGDAFDSTVGVIGSPGILTDGMWAWPGDLAYYIEKYHPTLPVEFVSHIRDKSFRPPTTNEEVDVTELDL